MEETTNCKLVSHKYLINLIYTYLYYIYTQKDYTILDFCTPLYLNLTLLLYIHPVLCLLDVHVLASFWYTKEKLFRYVCLFQLINMNLVNSSYHFLYQIFSSNFFVAKKGREICIIRLLCIFNVIVTIFGQKFKNWRAFIELLDFSCVF